MTWKVVLMRLVKTQGRKKQYPVDKLQRETLYKGLSFAEARRKRAALMAELSKRGRPEIALVAERS